VTVTISSVRIAHATLIVGVAFALIAAALLWLSRTYNFYFDDGNFVLTAPDWTWVTYLQPHNEHPSILFRLLYAALLNTVGMRSYVPYMVTGLTRAELGYRQSGSGRYVYEGAVFWLVLLAGAARNLPWRGSWLLVVVAAGELPWPLSALPILIAVAVWLAVLIVPSPPPARREEVRPRPRSGRHPGGAPTSEAQPAQ